jgi:hypothetical protein
MLLPPAAPRRLGPSINGESRASERWPGTRKLIRGFAAVGYSIMGTPRYPAAKGGKAWPPLAMFEALLLAAWYDLSDVALAEALSDRAGFRRFCGFARDEETPERTAFVRFRRLLGAQGLDQSLFAAIARDLEPAPQSAKAPLRNRLPRLLRSSTRP